MTISAARCSELSPGVTGTESTNWMIFGVGISVPTLLDSQEVEMGDEANDPVVAVLPGQGWRIEWLNKKGKRESKGQLVGWLVHASGRTEPMATDDQGNLESLLEGDYEYRLLQPFEPFHL